MSAMGNYIKFLNHNPPQLLIEKVQPIVRDLSRIIGDFKPPINSPYQSNCIMAPGRETYVFNTNIADEEAGVVDIQVQVLEYILCLFDIMGVNRGDNDSEGKNRISSDYATAFCLNSSRWISLSTLWIALCRRCNGIFSKILL